MQITIQEIKKKESLNERSLKSIIQKEYHIKEETIKDFKLVKKSLDCRDKKNPFYVYQVVLEMGDTNVLHNPKLNNRKVHLNTHYEDDIKISKIETKERPIIVGFGPAGMFSALLFARAGMRPIIFERGTMVEKRSEDVAAFFEKGVFVSNSNVAFGEGGAGTFSDGKLNTNLNDPRIKFILKTFVSKGGKESIYYDSKPHVGTDKLRIVCQKIREEIISLGGQFHFESEVIDVKAKEVTVRTLDKVETYHSSFILLAIGHSAKDTYEMLYRNGFLMEPKPFSMGVRIEHLQKTINDIQYGNTNIHDPATYKIAVHLKDRDVYSFCMCPGGYVVASNSHPNEVVTNGMSYEARDGKNANSALLVNVRVEDYYKDSPLDGIYYQEGFERLCYQKTKSYQAPCNLVKEFLNDEVASGFRSVKPTYPLGNVFTSFDDLMPDYVIKGLKEGIVAINRKMPGFLDDDAILTGIESRSSSPVRIVRDENFLSNIAGVYPIGEGAGYAGGITSSALDGIKCAMKIMESLGGK